MGNRHPCKPTHVSQWSPPRALQYKTKKSSALHIAVDEGDLEEIGRLLKKGFDVNKRDESGMTPLHCAVLDRNSECVQMLLDAGAQIRMAQLQIAPIHFAAQTGVIVIVEMLLKHGDGINAVDLLGNTPLSLAIEFGHYDLAQILLRQGAGVSTRHVMSVIENGSVDILRLLFIWKPDLFEHLDFSEYRFTHKSWPALIFLMQIGKKFEAEAFIEKHKPVSLADIFSGKRIVHPPPHNDPKLDPQSFEQFIDYLRNHSGTLPLSLKMQSRLAFLKFCGHLPIDYVLGKVICPPPLKSYLLYEDIKLLTST